MDIPWYIKSSKYAEYLQILFFLSSAIAHSYIEFVRERDSGELLIDWILYLPMFLSVCLSLVVICDFKEL